MLNQINKNLQHFYKMKVAINEAFDLAKLSTSPIPLSYKLLDNPQETLGNKSEILEEFLFCFRNDNKLILSLIENCPKDKSQYESLSRFLVHNFYENILNSTFVQEEMLVLLYLLLEELIVKGNVTVNKKGESHYLGGTFLFEMLRSLSLKEDIRAYLSVILNKVVIKLENITDSVLTVKLKEVQQYLKEKSNSKIQVGKNSKRNRNSFEQSLSENINAYDYIKSQNLTLSFLKEQLQNVQADTSKSLPEERDFLNFNIAMMESKGEKSFSSDSLLNEVSKKDETVINELMLNIRKTIYLIDLIIQNLHENISTIPYNIRCLCKIINTLITEKYKSKLNDYEKISYTITFFFESFLIPIILYPDHHGVITTSIISSNVRKSLNTISNILTQIRKGVLFTSKDKDYSEYTIFNMYIIKIIPKILHIFNGIRSTKLPTVLEKLMTQRTNSSRDINYTYFKHNPTENITHQSICFNWENILSFIKIIKKNKSKFIEIAPEMKNTFEKVILYENDFVTWIAKDNQGVVKENRGMSLKIKEVKYAYFGKIIFKEEFKAILDGKKTNQSTNAFSFTTDLNNSIILRNKSKKESSQSTNSELSKETMIKQKKEAFLSSIKKSIFEVLQFINTISKDNFFFNEINDKADSFELDILPTITNMIRCEMSNNVSDYYLNKDKDKAIPIVFCLTFIQNNLHNIPVNYKTQNYKLLFSEMLREAELSVQKAKNDAVNQIYLKIKNSDKLNMIMSNTLSQLKQMEKIITVENLVDALNVKTKLEYKKTGNNQIESIFLDKQDSSGCNVEESITSIKAFIELFPNFVETDENPLEYEENIEVDKVVSKFFSLIKQNLKTNDKMSRYTPEEFGSVNEAIQNYIMSKIHDKLVPCTRTKKDIFIHNKCKRLHWVKPKHLIKDQKLVNEKLWTLAMEYINNMDNEKTPSSKIKCFNKAFAILQNSITFCTGKDELGVDDSLQVLIYVLIKAQPKKIWTNFNYARLYIDPELSKKRFGLLLTQLEMVITVIKDLKYTDLIGVTEEQFGKDGNMDDINIENDDYS